jgi:hypothetical protein
MMLIKTEYLRAMSNSSDCHDNPLLPISFYLPQLFADLRPFYQSLSVFVPQNEHHLQRESYNFIVATAKMLFETKLCQELQAIRWLQLTRSRPHTVSADA